MSDAGGLLPSLNVSTHVNGFIVHYFLLQPTRIFSFIQTLSILILYCWSIVCLFINESNEWSNRRTSAFGWTENSAVVTCFSKQKTALETAFELLWSSNLSATESWPSASGHTFPIRTLKVKYANSISPAFICRFRKDVITLSGIWILGTKFSYHGNLRSCSMCFSRRSIADFLSFRNRLEPSAMGRGFRMDLNLFLQCDLFQKFPAECKTCERNWKLGRCKRLAAVSLTLILLMEVISARPILI